MATYINMVGSERPVCPPRKLKTHEHLLGSVCQLEGLVADGAILQVGASHFKKK